MYSLCHISFIFHGKQYIINKEDLVFSVVSLLTVNVRDYPLLSMGILCGENNLPYICLSLHIKMTREVTETWNSTLWATTWQNQQSDCAPSKDSDQPGHPPSLIRVFAVRMKKAWVFSYPLSAQRRLWSDWADAQAELSLHWAHIHFVGFVMSCLTVTLMT